LGWLWCADREDGAADGDLGLLRPEASRSQAATDDRLISADRGLDQRTRAVAGSGLPLHPAIRVDRHDMTVPLATGFGIAPLDGIGARRNNDGNAGAVVADGVVGWFAVIGAIGRELPNRAVDLVEQQLHLRGIAGILVGHDLGDDLAAVGIQCQMQFTPASPRPGTMVFLQPLAGAVDLKPGAVDEDVHRSFR